MTRSEYGANCASLVTRSMTFGFCLRDEQAVEWIAMVERQFCHFFRMPRVNRHLVESVLLHLFNQSIEIGF